MPTKTSNLKDYLKKRTDLMGQKVELQEKLARRERPGTDRFEPLIDFVNWTNGLNEVVFTGIGSALAGTLKKAYSNRAIFNKELQLAVEPPYSLLAKKATAGKWCPVQDSNL